MDARSAVDLVGRGKQAELHVRSDQEVALHLRIPITDDAEIPDEAERVAEDRLDGGLGDEIAYGNGLLGPRDEGAVGLLVGAAAHGVDVIDLQEVGRPSDVVDDGARADVAGRSDLLGLDKDVDEEEIPVLVD